jgi:hypothetical protein
MKQSCAICHSNCQLKCQKRVSPDIESTKDASQLNLSDQTWESTFAVGLHERHEQHKQGLRLLL